MKYFYGVRDGDVNHILIREDGADIEMERQRVSPNWLHNVTGWDWGEVSEEDKAKGDGRNPTKWGRVLETSRHLLSAVFGDMLSDYTVRMGRYQAVRHYINFAREVLTGWGDEWLVSEAEIRAWLVVAEHNRKSEKKGFLALPGLNPTVEKEVKKGKTRRVDG